MFAIVGIAAQLPSGQYSSTDLGYEEFWSFLLQGEHAFEDLNELKLRPNPFESVDLSKMPQKGAFLKNMAEFDYSSFGLSSADARVMPHSARRLMELSFHALRDAGIQTREQAIGCFMSGNNDLDVDAMNTDGSLAYIPSAIPNRISYAFNLTGPSVAVDTACSSSLTGLHLAISAIKNGDCTAALVGAAQSNRKITEWWRYDRARVLSSAGVCKPFDGDADGFARGEGAIVIVIKSLQDALKDKDRIYCTIAGSSHGATGSEFPVYVPNGTAQQICMSQAYEKAGRKPAEADYVELHMTGTRVGDPIEANAAGETFCRNESSVRVGSVKGNVGHLECAAFLVSLVKACHIFEKGIIPPTANFSVPNRAISWDKFKIEVVTEPVPLGCKVKDRLPLISIASAGIGGSHGHVLLEGPPLQRRDITSLHPERDTPVLFLIGGLTPNAVQNIVQQLSHLPDEHQIILENAVIASRQARQLPWRSFLIRKNNGVSFLDIPRPVLAPTKLPQLAFVFSGQGPHNAQMGHQLFQQYPIFRNTIIELDEVHEKVMGYSLLKTTGLFSREIVDPRVLQRKWPVILTLPALVMVHIGIFDLLRSMGITPDYLLGHSAGETAVVYASGAGSKAMAMEIALARGRSMTCTESMDAGMAVVACDALNCQALIDEVHRDHAVEFDVEISCFNAAESVVVSGKRVLVDAIITLARGRGIFAQGIHTLVPGHCTYIEHCREEHTRLMEDIFVRYSGSHTPVIPVFSTCRPGEMVEEFTADYFWNNARNPVYFSDALSRVLACGNPSTTMFVEISPHPVLSGAVIAHDVPTTRTLCPMQRLPRDAYDSHHETTCLLTSVAQLALAGYDRIDLSGIYGVSGRRKPLFDHPLQQAQVPPSKTFAMAGTKPVNPLLSSLPSFGKDVMSLFRQHRVGDVPVVPGTGWIEMALEAGGRYLWDVEFQTLFTLQQDRTPALHFEREGRNKWSITSSQTPNAQNIPTRTVIATGCLGTNTSYRPHTDTLDVGTLQAELGIIPLQRLHEVFGDHYYYGPSFVRLLNLYGNPSEILAEIRGLDEEERLAGYILHPAILDACIRVVAYKELLQDWETGLWFPKRIGRFILYHGTNFSASLFTHARLRRWGPDSRLFNILVTNDQGHPICKLEDFMLQRAPSDVILRPRRALKLTTDPLVIPSIVFPESRFFQNQDEQAYMRLYLTLDRLALDRLQKTFKGSPNCAKTVDRTRYLKRMVDLMGQDTSQPLQESDIREQELKWPAFFEVTRRIGEVHESTLHSSQAAVNVLFADDLMGRYYAEHNQLTKACEEMSQQLDDILKALSGSGKHVVKVLEIGAGTGTLTRQLAPILKMHDQLVIEYTVTDVSYSLVADLANSMGLERLIPKAYDATKDPYDQGLSPESFDIIIAYHVLHVAPELRVLGQRLHDLLVPGGFLLVTEVDNTLWSDKPGAAWMDFVFGSFAEWFNYQDDRDHCSMSPSRWEALLQSTGFSNFSSVIGSRYCLDFIFTCQKKVEPTRRIIQQPPTITLHQYRDGQVLSLQQLFRTFNPSHDGVMCLWTDNKYDSDSAIGLVITLAKEFTTWTIWLAMFDAYVHPTQVADIVKDNHLHLSRERLVHFSADGNPSFPRVVRLPPVSAESTSQISSLLPKDHLIVQMVEYDPDGSFMGQVVKSEDREIPEQSFVAGLTANVGRGGLLTLHSGRTTRLAQPDRRILPYLSAMLLQFHLLGPSRFMYSAQHHPSLRVLIVLSNKELTQALRHLLQDSCGVVISTEAQESLVDVVVTDHKSLETNPLLEQSVGTNGRLVIWSPQLLERTVSQEPWILRYILGAGIHNLNLSPVETQSVSALIDVVHTSPNTPSRTSLFDPNKAYLLIGGIGGIGIHLAVWLHKNGARHIYLTSRRGRDSILQADDIVGYKVAYLERQTNLNLKLVACDALNANEMDIFLKSVQLPIGGCFLMPLILRDSLFLQQTQDTMDLVKRSKVEAFDILSSLCDVKAMDFFVAFSSVTAVWGNAGQSNYGSACAILGGKMSEYPNAFALLVPAIMDAGYLAKTGILDRVNFQGAHEWGIGVEDLCEYIRDGITRVKQGVNPSTYIPDLDLSVVTKYISLPSLYQALIPPSSSRSRKGRGATSQKRGDAGQDIQSVLKAARETIKTSLEIEDENAFSPEMPFINCGLDSIRATRLSRQLRPYIEISQTDLLLGISWADLEERIKHNHATRTQPSEVVETCKRLVLSALGMESTDTFSPDIPFVNSGLDSIRATQLARQLKPHIQVSHTDLLLGMSWTDLEAKITQAHSVEDEEQNEQNNSRLSRSVIEECKNLVIESLGIDAGIFDSDIPFLNYGLDSIRATRLSRQLKSYVEVSQMDLLMGMAWRGLEEKITCRIAPEGLTQPTEDAVKVPGESKRWSVSFKQLNEATGDGPVILALPGATGTLSTISPLMNHASRGSTTLWAAHFDLSACNDSPPSLQELGNEILAGMKERHPTGALRIISVSGSSTLAFLLTEALEAEGRQVLDVSFLDHFPALFCHDSYGLAPYMSSQEDEREALKALDDVAERGVEIMLRMQEIDSTMKRPPRQSENDHVLRLEGVKGLETARLLNGITIRFIKELYYRSRKVSEEYTETLARWLGSVKAPVLVVVADQGFNLVVEMPWADMGAKRVLEYKNNVRVLHIDAGHFAVVGHGSVARQLRL